MHIMYQVHKLIQKKNIKLLYTVVLNVFLFLFILLYLFKLQHNQQTIKFPSSSEGFNTHIIFQTSQLNATHNYRSFLYNSKQQD